MCVCLGPPGSQGNPGQRGPPGGFRPGVQGLPGNQISYYFNLFI